MNTLFMENKEAESRSTERAVKVEINPWNSFSREYEATVQGSIPCKPLGKLDPHVESLKLNL